MSSASAAPSPLPRAGRPSRAVVAGVVLLVLAAVVGLTWAKWSPYLERARSIHDSGAYPGGDVLAKAGEAGSAPSASGAWDFFVAYGTAIWPALVVAIVLGAGVEAALPRAWVVRALGPSGARGAAAGGVGALPTMMCTCCAAPVTVSLRRRGASASAALAFWVGNPLLNPAVLVFLALLLPWPWVATRVVIGVAVVFGATVLVARLARRGGGAAGPGATVDVPPALPGAPGLPGEEAVGVGGAGDDEGSAGGRFVRALVRYVLILVPEYVVLVLLIGALRGWLLPVGGPLSEPTLLVVLAAAVLGTLVVLPTGGEIPVVLGLTAAGVGTGVLGALLIVLPALSVVSMVLVGRAIGARATVAMGGAVVVAGLAGAALLPALGG